MKISSRVRQALEAMGGKSAPVVLRRSDRRSLFAFMDDMTDRSARLMLVELLNLGDDPQRIEAVKRQLRRAGVTSVDNEPNAELLKLRDTLRDALAAPSTRLFKQTLRSLMEGVDLDCTLPSSDLRSVYVLDWGERRPGSQDWFVSWIDGLIRPLPDANFRGTLAWAVMRILKDVAYCDNPDCPAPYYLRRRRDQKYCTANDECARFAGREAARRYWRSKAKRSREE